jgi:hypothetical protein
VVDTSMGRAGSGGRGVAGPGEVGLTLEFGYSILLAPWAVPELFYNCSCIGRTAWIHVSVFHLADLLRFPGEGTSWLAWRKIGMTGRCWHSFPFLPLWELCLAVPLP